MDALFTNLAGWFASRAERGLALAFSGGVDSSLLLALLVRHVPAARRLAVFFQGPAQSLEEAGWARRVAAELGSPLEIVAGAPLTADLRLRDNPPDRCYWCKRALLEKLGALACERRLQVVLDGTNADDLQVYRPGRRALLELGIASPLAELGIGKAAVRALAQELGLSVAARPSSPCLATRFDYGTRLTEAALSRVAAGEAYLAQQGLSPVRLRVQGGLARLEVRPEQFAAVLAGRAAIAAKLRELGYRFVTLDLEGYRSGCYDDAAASGQLSSERFSRQ